MNLIKRIAIAANQSMCLVITGQNDFTISGYSYVRAIRDGKPFCMNVVDKLFFWQDEHCKKTFLWEMKSAKSLYNDFEWILELNSEENKQ